MARWALVLVLCAGLARPAPGCLLLGEPMVSEFRSPDGRSMARCLPSKVQQPPGLPPRLEVYSLEGPTPVLRWGTPLPNEMSYGPARIAFARDGGVLVAYERFQGQVPVTGALLYDGSGQPVRSWPYRLLYGVAPRGDQRWSCAWVDPRDGSGWLLDRAGMALRLDPSTGQATCPSGTDAQTSVSALAPWIPLELAPLADAPALRQALQNPQASLLARLHAASALWTLGDPSGRELILRASATPAPPGATTQDRVVAVVFLLDHLGPTHLPQAEATIRDVDGAYVVWMQALARAGDAARPMLDRFRRSGSWNLRALAEGVGRF